MSDTSGSRSVRRTERRLNAPLLPALAGLFAVLFIWTGYHGWLVFLLGTAGLWLLAAWWIFSLARGLHIDRQIHLAWASVGESVPEQLEITNRSRFPAIWLEVVDESQTLVEPLRLVSGIDGRATRRRHPVHLFKRRGLYTLGPTRLRTGDPFGVYTLTLRDEHTSTILVTPPQLPLAQLQIAPGGWAGDMKRQNLSLAREISDASLREYAPGDSLRRIHWRASAHHDSLIVRQMEASAAEDWWIFVDLQAEVQAGTGTDSTLELSIVLAASLAVRGLKERRRVGLALIGPKMTWIEPRADLAHRWQILRALAAAEAGDRPLAELLSVGRPSRTASIIVITPTTDPAWVARAVQHNSSGTMTVFLVNPTEFGGKRDQAAVAQALARSRIAHKSMPAGLLAAAYHLSARDILKESQHSEARRKRYLAGSKSTWRTLD